MNRLQFAIDQIVFARNYTVGLLDQTPEADWVRQPVSGVSHIAWQVGHLAFAEYRMAMWRIRGERSDDKTLLPQEYFALFGPKSIPDTDIAKYPPMAEIRSTFGRVHDQALRELKELPEAELDEPVPHPHKFANTKLRALLWCAHHEMVHAGQIGLLRRQLGCAPMW